jgi:hypothetical protein
MGMLREAPIMLALQCAGMSSYPSSVCTQGALGPCTQYSTWQHKLYQHR